MLENAPMKKIVKTNKMYMYNCIMDFGNTGFSITYLLIESPLM